MWYKSFEFAGLAYETSVSFDNEVVEIKKCLLRNEDKESMSIGALMSLQLCANRVNFISSA